MMIQIVDMGLTLMSQASLPLYLWPYAFSTSVFLINRLPSPHRGFISPWERLFGSIPSYSSFRSFGCACYPLLRPYSKHKFLHLIFTSQNTNSLSILQSYLVKHFTVFLSVFSSLCSWTTSTFNIIVSYTCPYCSCVCATCS